MFSVHLDRRGGLVTTLGLSVWSCDMSWRVTVHIWGWICGIKHKADLLKGTTDITDEMQIFDLINYK